MSKQKAKALHEMGISCGNVSLIIGKTRFSASVVCCVYPAVHIFYNLCSLWSKDWIYSLIVMSFICMELSGWQYLLRIGEGYYFCQHAVVCH